MVVEVVDLLLLIIFVVVLPFPFAQAVTEFLRNNFIQLDLEYVHSQPPEAFEILLIEIWNIIIIGTYLHYLTLHIMYSN